MMNITKVATFRSPFSTKFGIPRQANVVNELMGTIVFEKPFRAADAIRGMEDFDYLWLVWGFSGNRNTGKGTEEGKHLMVRPPRLGGNKQMGVFATRSPFRPNPLGLSSVKLHHIDYTANEAPVIYVCGADLMDGTPIYDIKPYIPYTDAHPEARGGFATQVEWKPLQVIISEKIRQHFGKLIDLPTLEKVLEQDPRPQYHNDGNRTYGMPFGGYDIHFMVKENVLTITDITKL